MDRLKNILRIMKIKLFGHAKGGCFNISKHGEYFPREGHVDILSATRGMEE